jgi:hypothetical protein
MTFTEYVAPAVNFEQSISAVMRVAETTLDSRTGGSPVPDAPAMRSNTTSHPSTKFAPSITRPVVPV